MDGQILIPFFRATRLKAWRTDQALPYHQVRIITLLILPNSTLQLPLAENPKLEIKESRYEDHVRRAEPLLQKDLVLSSDDERPLLVKIRSYPKEKSDFLGRRVGSSIKLKIPDDRVDVRSISLTHELDTRNI